MSYGRMRDKQRQLREEVNALLAQAEAADAAEDAAYGADRGGDELPAELQRRESRLQRIRDAKRVLEARAKDEAAAAGKPTESAKPEPKAQYNFTDPESRIMKGPDGFVQAYNVQVAVDDLQLIVGQAVTQETNDKKQLMPMITTIEQQSGDTPTQLLADAGYCSDESLTAIANEGDPDNVRRLGLSRALATKAARPRYEAFLERAPAFIAARARHSRHGLPVAIKAWEDARQLAASAIPLSLDPATVVFEMCGHVAEAGRS